MSQLVHAGGDHGTQGFSSPLRDALQRALDPDLSGVNRLTYARTTVRFVVPATGESVTLALDVRPPALLPGDAPGEIELRFSAEAARSFASGTLPLPAAILSGWVEASGPVRQYLEVDPMLRARLAHHAGDRGTPAPYLTGTPTDGLLGRRDLLAVEARGVVKRFGATQVLAGVDLQIPEGMISVVLGPSGTGKSVLLKHITGLLRPDAGEVLIRGRSLNRMSRSELLAQRREIGVMFQDGALFSTMNVFDNVAYPLRQHTDLSEVEIADIVMRHLRSVGLADAVSRMPNELSGGMRKRAGLARSFALDPGIVLCDEPDSGLDPVRTALLGELIVEQHASNGGTVVVITHNVPLARLISDHVSILWQGRILASGLSGEIFESDDPFVRQFLSGSADGPLGMDA